MVISWDNIDRLEDYYITYLLYKESLNIDQISRIRNKSREDVCEDLLKAKQSIEKIKIDFEDKENILHNYMALSRDDRLDFISGLEGEKLRFFKSEVYSGIVNLKNADDITVLVWTAGELKDERFLNILYSLTKSKHSNLRRISYSSIGKIGKAESRKVLENGLNDKNPQTRQYCAKYLGEIGDAESMEILENFVKSRRLSEKDYVLRACNISLEKLYSKFKKVDDAVQVHD